MPDSQNPFFRTWDVPFGVPPFADIRPEHFGPAYDRGFAEHKAEVAAIVADPQPPNFENTIAALENSGRLLARVDAVFHTLAGANSNDAILAIEREISPRAAAHWNAIRLDGKLFARLDAIVAARETAGLTGEQAKVLERYHTKHKRAGAGLDVTRKKRLAEIAERLAVLGTAFSQNVLADEQDYALMLDAPDDLAGLPDFVIEAASAAATERGAPDGYAITTARSSVEPFLQFSAHRDLREKAFRAWIARGDNNGATDNKAIIAETVALRAETARLMDYPSFGHFRLDDAMAKTPEAVRDLLEKVWTPARKKALADRDAMQDIVRAEGGNFALAGWDWRYYSEKLRKLRHDVDEAAVKPFMALDRIIEAAFHTANRLFGLSFAAIDVPVWHPDVGAWEVTGRDGEHVGVFFGDYFARSGKRSGAWMGTLREQERFIDAVRPLVVNVMNFNKGDPTLLSFDDARTLFHEMGHAMHGLLSNVSYPFIQGTSVKTDWVELPSQLFEHWLEQPAVLKTFARHVDTGAAMPDELLAKVLGARTHNRGADTLEYLSSAIVDLDLHLLSSAEGLDPGAFERETLARIGMPDELAMRHRPPHFAHVFSGGYYASAYYSYLWSEVLDSDAFRAFEETGDVFDAATADKLRRFVLETGGSAEPETLYRAFRGRMPDAQALLERRGLADAA